jgi:hypothetical protein
MSEITEKFNSFQQGFIEGKAYAANYYETVIIPQQIKEAEKKLIEEIESIYRFPRWVGCSNPDCNPQISEQCKPLGQCPYAWWQQLKQKRGI